MPELQNLIQSYYHSWFRFHPEVAVDLGIAGYSHLLTPCGDDDIGALISLNEKLLASLDELDDEQLDETARVDVRLMYGAAMLELESLAEQDWRHRQPARFLPINAIYQLTLRTVDNLHQAMKGRLDAIPAHLREARSFLIEQPEQIPLLWLDMAIEEAQHGAEYLRDLRQHPHVQPLHFEHELEVSAHAVEQFADFLQDELRSKAKGDFACGEAFFERSLRYRHGLEINANQLHAFGKKLYDDTWQALKAVTLKLRGDEDIEAMTQSIQKNHPEVSTLLQSYRTQMEEAKAFVKEKNVIPLPENEVLKVIETPAFMRHAIPFAAYMEPAPADVHQKGLYYVTLPKDEPSLGEHNYFSQRHTCVHEAWPGHHLQFVTANNNPEATQFPRLTNSSATLYEGWALYCEQLMHELGFLDQPESEFILLKDRLWRAMRVMLDVELHTRGLSLDEAAEKMQQTLGFTREQAMGDLGWYTLAPTTPMGYATGWALMIASRDYLQAQPGKFNLYDFHEKILGEGSIALSYILQKQFGESLWSKVKQTLFN